MKALVGLPELSVAADGVALKPAAVAALTEVLVQQRLSMPALCELVFDDPPGALPARHLISPGTSLSLSVAGAKEPLFSGEVTALEQVYRPDRGRQLRVRGYDLTHRLRKRRQVRSFPDASVASLAAELVSDLGLEVEGGEDGPSWALLVQDRQSDLELLVETLERCGLYYTVREATLRLLTLEGIGAPIDLELGETLLEATLEVNADPAVRTVSISGWDPLTIATHGAEAGKGRVPWPAPEETDPERFGSDGRLLFVNEGLAADDQATAIAAGELDRRLAGEAVLDAVAEGDPALRPGAVVTIRGAADPVEDTFTLTSVDHVVDPLRGFFSKLSSRPPVAPDRPHQPAVTIGVVTRVDDPDGKGRVRVRLPSFGDLETGWLEVAALAAGAGKGMIALPDAEDTVLLLLPFQDPASGIVLAGLYGDAGAPIAGGVADGAVRVFALLTAGGMKLSFDDGNQRIRLEDGRGSSLELAADKVTLRSAPDLEILAPGRRILIRGAAIDFETA